MTGRCARVLAALVVGVVLSGANAAARTSASVIEFRAVLAELPPVTATSSTLAPADRVDAALKVASCDTAAVQALSAVPTTASRTAKPDDCVVYPASSTSQDVPRYYLGPAAVTGQGISRAKAQFVSGQGWTVRLDLTKSGARAWDDLAREQFHEQVAFVVDGKVVAAPTIQPNDAAFVSFGGRAVVSGVFGKQGAAAIARRANGQ